MGRIISNKCFSPQEYIELITDKCYYFHEEDTLEEINQRLKENHALPILNFSIDDTRFQGSACEDICFVLVDTSYISDKLDKDGHFEMIPHYSFFEVPNGIVERKFT